MPEHLEVWGGCPGARSAHGIHPAPYALAGPRSAGLGRTLAGCHVPLRAPHHQL